MILRLNPGQKEHLARLFQCEFEDMSESAVRDITTAQWAMSHLLGRSGLTDRELCLVAVLSGHITLPDDVFCETKPVPERAGT